MNLKDFQDKCFAYNPKFTLYYERIGTQEYVYFHDDTLKNMFNSQRNSLYIDKFREALAVWCDGLLLKDRYGIFTQTSSAIPVNSVSSNSPVVYTLPSNNSYPGYYTVGGGGSGGSSSPNGGNGCQFSHPIDYGFETEKKLAISAPQCECGAHKVNSNSHSSWCPIKESNV